VRINRPASRRTPWIGYEPIPEAPRRPVPFMLVGAAPTVPLAETGRRSVWTGRIPIPAAAQPKPIRAMLVVSTLPITLLHPVRGVVSIWLPPPVVPDAGPFKDLYSTSRKVKDLYSTSRSGG
jgi:hypothetical protein